MINETTEMVTMSRSEYNKRLRRATREGEYIARSEQLINEINIDRVLEARTECIKNMSRELYTQEIGNLYGYVVKIAVDIDERKEGFKDKEFDKDVLIGSMLAEIRQLNKVLNTAAKAIEELI